MLGKAVTFEKLPTEPFNFMEQINAFQGDFYVWGVCAKAHGIEASPTCPIGWMDDLYELAKEADKIFTFNLPLINSPIFILVFKSLCYKTWPI